MMMVESVIVKTSMHHETCRMDERTNGRFSFLFIQVISLIQAPERRCSNIIPSTCQVSIQESTHETNTNNCTVYFSSGCIRSLFLVSNIPE